MRTTSEETARNNQIILDAAIKVFSEKGYEATNMQDIAAEAKISRGPLYYRYPSKDALFKDAVKEYARNELQQYQTIFNQNKPILDIIRDDLDYCTRNIRLEMSVPRLDVPDIKELKESYDVLDDVVLKIYQLKEVCIRQAVRKGELKEDCEPRQIVNLLFIFVEGLYATVQKSKLITSTNETNAVIEDLIYLLETKYCC